MKTCIQRSHVPLASGGSTWALALAAASLILMLPGSVQAAAQKSFCEAGYAESTSFGAAGAVWVQSWGLPLWDDWFDCTSKPNVGILDESVVGELRTKTTGAPQIDQNLVLAWTDHDKRFEDIRLAIIPPLEAAHGAVLRPENHPMFFRADSCHPYEQGHDTKRQVRTRHEKEGRKSSHAGSWRR